MIDTERAEQAPTAELTIPAQRTIRRTITYRVPRGGLASTKYRCLRPSQWKPPVLTTAELGRIIELAVMPAIPGVSLGTKVDIEHLGPAVRGSVVTVTATCIEPRGRYWHWDVIVRDAHEIIGRGTLGFVGDIDVADYTERRLRPKLAARTIGVAWWLRFLDALTLLIAMATPVQVTYFWHNWRSMVATETILVVGWAATLTGVPGAIRDLITIRTRPTKKS